MPDAPVLDLHTLGAAFVRGPDGAVIQGLGAKSLGALVFLALSPGGAAPRDVLVDLLWGRGAPEQGRASLRQELRRMKKALGPLFEAAVETPGGQIALRPGAVRCDALELERACEARDTAGLAALLGLCGGAFLAPLSVPETAFQDWQAERNSRAESLATEGLLRLMLLDESAGRLDRAAAAARALLALDPLQEDVHAALVRLHVAAGRPALARRQIESARALFMAELGEPPETDLEALLPAPPAAPAPAARGARRPAP
ncbi:MAG: BTAD domain-containing putative transcriptional regulator [Paracoccaceae bacterium]